MDEAGAAASRVHRIVREAAAAPESERAALIERACGGDAALRAAVEAGLREASSGGNADAGAGAPTASLSPGEWGRETVVGAGGRHVGPGACVGPYRLLQLLGEGGFGEVYLAEQERPVRRRVAVKIIKAGMDTRAVIARFEAERQALAVMDHPNVAKVFDAGSTEAGRPYFVMEYVQGEPITAYCDRHMLTLRQRLELFIPVCEAVQHSHMKGIIHRDLKPSNILVTMVDDRPVPKVIDFGIAKAVSSRLTERTLFTEHGVLIGTPEYMSPEQAEVGSADIDTRSDVYSLGVVLYELLTGAGPFDSQELRRAAYARIQQIIREVEPPRPSTRLTSLGAGGAVVADRRRTRLDELARELRSELEWIPLKAMRKDRTQRYRSAMELADDIRNYLAGRPLAAGPESAAYRVRKFIRRHRAPAAAGAAIAASLVLGVVGISWGLVRERGLRAAADEQRERAEAAERAATARLAESMTVQRFLREMLESVDPERAGGREVTVREILDAAAGRIGDSLADQPLVEAALRQTLGATYHQLGRYAEAEAHLRRAVELRLASRGERDPETLDSLNALGATLLSGDKADEAAVVLRRAMEGRREVLGPTDPATLETQSLAGFAVQLLGRPEEAERIYRETLAAQREHAGAAAKATLETMASLADVLQDLGRLEEAEQVARELVETAVGALGEESPSAMMGMSILGSILENRGKFAEAVEVGRRVLALKTKVYGEDHYQTFQSVNALALALQAVREYDEEVALLARVVELAERSLGPEHEATLTYTANLGRAEQLRGNLDQAEALIRRVYEARRRLHGPAAQGTLIVQNNLGLLLLDRKKPAEAEPLFRDMVAGIDQLLPEGHWMRSAARASLGNCLLDLGRYEEAERVITEAYEGLKASLGEGHQRTLLAAGSLADVYKALGKPELEATWRGLATPTP